jgi:hypothetical protein
LHFTCLTTKLCFFIPTFCVSFASSHICYLVR